MTNRASNHRRKAVIVGCGIAGPVLAIALQRAGIDSVIHEGRPEARDESGSFLGLAPNGRDVLATLGNGHDIDAVGVPTPRIAFLNHKGKQLAEMPQPVITFKRGLLMRALREAAMARGIRVENGKRLVDVEDGSRDGVVAHFEDGSRAAGDFLVGCDGIWSRTRRLILPNAPAPRFTGIISSGGYARLDSVAPSHGTMRMTFCLNGFFGYQVLDSGEIYWFENVHRTTEPAAGDLESIPDARWKQMLLDLHRPDHAPIPQIIAATAGEIARFAVYEMPVLPVWHKGRICLAGDAAHATGPHSGQGGSLAMEDAVVLAKCLRDIPDIDAAFAAYQRIRKARVEHVVHETRRIGDRKAPPGLIGRLTRDLVLPLFLKKGMQTFGPIYSHHIDWDEPVTIQEGGRAA